MIATDSILDAGPENAPVETAFSQRPVVRFGTTFVTSLLSSALGFCSGIVIARILHPAKYGDLNFLTSTFAAIIPLLEMGTSRAFYNFIARKKQTPKFFALYFAWVALQLLTMALIIGWLLPKSLVERIWLVDRRGLVFIAFAAMFAFNLVWQSVSQLGEARRKTLVVQSGVAIQAFMHLLLVGAAAYLHVLTIRWVLAFTIFEWSALALVYGPYLLRQNMVHVSGPSVKVIVQEYIAFCKPLIYSTWASFFYAFADRWLLQRFGGSEQQGFLSISQQLSSVSLIVTTSLFMVLWKEMAEAYEHKNMKRLQTLCHATTRTLYLVVAWISCLFIPYTHEILRWSVGKEYKAAWACLAILFLYPLHQSLAYIYTTLFMVTGNTKSFVQIAIAMMLVSLPITYFLLAAPNARIPGLGWGSIGLALRLVGLQVIWVNLYGYVVSRKLGWDYDFTYQASILGFLLVMGLVCRWISGMALGRLSIFGDGALGTVAGGALLYAGATLFSLYRFPKLAGLSADEVASRVNALRREWHLFRREPLSQS